MFFVVSDLSEKQRERLTSFLSIQGMDVTAYTFKKVKVAFGKIFVRMKAQLSRDIPFCTEHSYLKIVLRKNLASRGRQSVHMEIQNIQEPLV